MFVIRAIALFALAPVALLSQQPAPAAPAVPASPRAFQPADWHRVTTLGSPAMSPDGKRVAFTVTTIADRENRRHSEIWVVNTSGGDPVRWSSPSTESSNPRWTPDGKYLLFTSNRPGGKGNTWALRLDEPGGEATQLENYPLTGSSPKDRSLAVFSDITDTTAAAGGGAPRGGRGPGGPNAAGPAGTGALNTPPFGSITKPLDAGRFDGRHFNALPYKANGTGFLSSPREARVWRPTQVFTQKYDGSKRVQLTDTKYSHRDVVASPDGKWIAFTADAKLRSDSAAQEAIDSIARLPYDRAREEIPRNDRDIYVIPSTGGEPRAVATLQGDEGSVDWSPDSKKISFISRALTDRNSRLYLIDLAGGAPQNLLGGWQYEPSGGFGGEPPYTWLVNGDIAMSAEVGGRTALFIITPKNGQMREVISGRRVMRGFSFDEKRKTVAFVATSVTKPTEIYVADADGRNERRLTSFNDRLNAEIAWADAERFTYPSVGGLTIEGWLMKPYGYQPGKRYPLVLYIHGGPHSAYNEGWFDEFQNLAGAGMFVLYTNPRGSSGYGADFTYSTRGRWFAEDYQDLMKATDMVAQRPDVDSTRMGVTGGSYGGVMTAWITSHTTRYRAAQADRMIDNWWSWYGTSDAQGLTEYEFFGKPWENPAMYDSLSPIRYVSRVKTPTLMVQSEEDHRTPMTDADQWFLALKKLDVPVEFVRYPRSNHDLSRTGEPWLLVDRLSRLRQWFTHWLKP